ncbi:MAG: glycosyltransferase, partial [Chloroflexi bacterium]|nr:glycosyltransferase [Chloroflexota bacterium]
VFTARKRRLAEGVGAMSDPDTLLFGYNWLQARPGLEAVAGSLTDRGRPVHVDVHEPEYRPLGRALMGLVGRLGPDVVQLRVLPQFTRNDVVFLTGGWPLLLASRLIPASRRPRLVWLNMTLTNLLRAGGIRARLIAIAARMADRIVCVSSDQQAYLSRRLGLPVSRLPVVRSGTDIRFFDQALASPVVDGGIPFVLAAGRDAGRDYATLCLAAAGASWPVTIVCSPRNMEGVRELRDLYAAARVVVIPTGSDDDAPVGSDCSGTLVLLDALAMGTPVVITSRRSVAEYAMEADTVTTVSVRDATGLRMALDAAMGVSRDQPRDSYGAAYPTTPSPVAGMGSSRTHGSTHPGNGRPRSTADFAAGVAAVFREVA